MILSSLLKTHGESLTNESLHTLLVEVEAIVNSCPLTTETINDVTSLIPLSPLNLLTMKSKMVMPPPGIFATPENIGGEFNIFAMSFGTGGGKRSY